MSGRPCFRIARRFVSIMPFIRRDHRSYADKQLLKYSATFTDAEMRRIASVTCAVFPDTGQVASPFLIELNPFR